MGGVEGQAPWCSWMASEDVRTLASGDVGDTHSVVTMSRGNLGSETNNNKNYKINKNVYKAQNLIHRYYSKHIHHKTKQQTIQQAPNMVSW